MSQTDQAREILARYPRTQTGFHLATFELIKILDRSRTHCRTVMWRELKAPKPNEGKRQRLFWTK